LFLLLPQSFGLEKSYLVSVVVWLLVL